MSQAASGSEFGPVDEKKKRRGKSETDVVPARSDKPSGSPETPPESEPQDDHDLNPSGQIPDWLDRAFPWIASVLIHLALFLLIAFLLLAVAEPKLLKPHPIIVPQSMNQMFSMHAGRASRLQSQNPLQQVRQDIKQLMTHNVSHTSANSLLKTTKHSLDFIARGATGGLGNKKVLTTLGVPGSDLNKAPPTSFLGSGGGNATRIVYIINHGGNLLVYIPSIEASIRRSIDRLIPLQRFGVIVFAHHSRLLAPGFVYATEANKRALRHELKSLTPGQVNQNRYEYFAKPFEMAFRMHPQVIYFLANGYINPKMISLLARLNKDHAVHIYTYAYADSKHHNRGHEGVLEKIARENGGRYKFISKQELGG